MIVNKNMVTPKNFKEKHFLVSKRFFMYIVVL